MLSKEQKLQKRKEIAKSTCNLFVKKGFVNISISEIAKEASIGKGTVYEYFSNKEDIVFELMSCLQEEYDLELEKKLEKSQNVKEKFTNLFSLYFCNDSKVQTQRDIYKEFLAITLNNPREDIIVYQDAMMDKYYQVLTKIFQEAIKNNEMCEDALKFIPSIFATMDGFLINRKTKEDFYLYRDTLFQILRKD